MASITDEAPTGRALTAAIVEFLMLGPHGDRRQLQDSPILADVWIAYANAPNQRQDLLITPASSCDAASLARTIRSRRASLEAAGDGSARLAYLSGLVAASLTFRELLALLLPIAGWWDNALKGRSTLRFTEGGGPLATMQAILRAAARSLRGGAPEMAGLADGLTRFMTLAAVLLAATDDPEPDQATADWLDRQADRAEVLLEALMKALSTLPADGSARIFQVALNRRVEPALDRSVAAVKGDAASRLFSIDCSRIAWAVLDTGIHETHPAFQHPVHGRRVRRTYDFTRLRDIISIDSHLNPTLIDELATETGLSADELRRRLEALSEAAENERPVQWSLVDALVIREAPTRPLSHHGTHVAGIIGGQEVVGSSGTKEAGGLCPDIDLYDFRVLGRSTEDTEFAVIGALQFIRHLNTRRSAMTIHGANLSLSIPHSVRNYACGRTPVCDECERLVDSGVVVVAAAGNRGYHNFQTADGAFESYAAFSITDPGNTEAVITVGATHRHSPHTYGVSFFSSRGPTGDGRLKPDLVAPGERIRSAVLDAAWADETGTSMAAPHVSGAAAILMARHAELVGRPRRIKQVLCDSATDLGRERSFQGHGMLDVLRALQSI